MPKPNRHLRLSRCSAILLLCAGGLATNAAGAAKVIELKAPRTLVVLGQKWAEAYSEQHPDAEIEVTSGGPDAGLTALQNNRTDLALSSRKITQAESIAYQRMFGTRPREYRVGVESLGIYVNAENPAPALDLEQVARIFTGKIRNWKQVGGADAPITVYSRDKKSGAYDFLQSTVLKGGTVPGGAQTMPSATAVLRAISRDKNGIGFAGWANSYGVKTLAIKSSPDSPAVEPTEDNLLASRYPIRRWLYIYLNAASDKASIAAFLDWIRSDEGQKVAQQTGCHPIHPNWRERTYADQKPQDDSHAQ
jgi:phosphate transport system substrate-binding protein